MLQLSLAESLPLTLPVQNYRYWIIWRCPSVRFLDYQKVKDLEREKATQLFGTVQEPSALASKVRDYLLSLQVPYGLIVLTAPLLR